jgi:hypothetical protein
VELITEDEKQRRNNKKSLTCFQDESSIETGNISEHIRKE